MAKPKIGVSMLYCLTEPFNKMITQIPQTETKHLEIVDDGLHTLDKRRTAKLKEVADSYGLEYSIHAPFAGINIAMPSKPLLTATLRRLKQSITNAGALGCRLWVLHPAMKTGISMFYPGKDWTRNLENVRLLAKLAEDHGVNVGIENVAEPFIMRNVENFKTFYDEFDGNVGFVLDTGHANMNGQLAGFLTELPEKMVHIHAHDNDGRTDQHLGIGRGTIDWQDFAALVRKAGFGGVVSVESVEHVKESVEKLRQLFA
jgi:sugar phosphate isomerase/epimerase